MQEAGKNQNDEPENQNTEETANEFKGCFIKHDVNILDDSLIIPENKKAAPYGAAFLLT